MPDTHVETQPKPVKLADYRPPAFLVDRVALEFDLDEAETTVTSRLELRRNLAAGEADAPLRLDGEDLRLVRLVLDGETLGSNRYRIEGGQLVIPDLQDNATLEVETTIAPCDNTLLTGLYVSGGSFFTQCEAEGFPPDHLFSRPSGRDGAVHDHDPGQRRPGPGAPLERQPRRARRSARRTALGTVGGPAPEALLSVRAGRGRPRRGARPLHDPLGPARRSGDLGAARRRGQVRPRDALPQEIDEMG